MSNNYSVKKIRYCEKLVSLIQENTNILLVNVDFVGSNQLHQIRAAIRGRAEILMGKNTQIRRVFREQIEDFPDLANLLPHITGNVGMIFTNESVKDIRDIAISFRVPAAAKSGTLAPSDVFVPAGPTALDPGQTAFFQSLGIATKIARGAIEILNDVHLIRKGDKVGSSETALLSKLNIKPFTYGLTLTQVYEMGSVYSPEILDMTQNVLLSKFFNGVTKVACIGLELGYPCLASLPHSLINAFKTLVAVAVETDYEFKEAAEIKAYLADPSAFAVAAGPAAGGAAVAVEAEPEEEESEEDFGGGGGLFGGSDDSDSDSDSD